MGLFEDLLSLNTEVRGEEETRRFYERFAICDLRFVITSIPQILLFFYRRDSRGRRVFRVFCVYDNPIILKLKVACVDAMNI